MNFRRMTKLDREELIIHTVVFGVMGSVILLLAAIFINFGFAEEVSRTEPTVITESVCVKSIYNASTKTTHCTHHENVERIAEIVTYEGPFWTYTENSYVR